MSLVGFKGKNHPQQTDVRGRYGESFGWVIVLGYDDHLSTSLLVHDDIDEARALLREYSEQGHLCWLARCVYEPGSTSSVPSFSTTDEGAGQGG